MATKSHQAVFAPTIVGELMDGNTGTTFSVLNYFGKVEQKTLAHLASCELGDMPGNVLHSILAYIGAQAKAGDATALHLAQTLADGIEGEYGTDDREPDPQDRRDARNEYLAVTQA